MSRLGGIVDVDAGQHGPGHDNDEYGDHHSNGRAQQRVETTPRDILLQHALIDDRTLLEEQHPGGDRGPYVSHQKEEELPVECSGEIWNQTLVDDVSNGRVDEKGPRD